MKTIKFSTKEYLNWEGIVMEDYLYVIITVDDVEFYKDSVNIEYWKNKTEEERLKYLFNYIPSDLADELYKKKAMFENEDIYDIWYEWYFYINGEDASDYILKVPRTLHPKTFGGFQASIAVSEGWEYYKKLVLAGFNSHTAANLAYWRGYIDGMDYARVLEKEGEEALAIMGLTKMKY